MRDIKEIIKSIQGVVPGPETSFHNGLRSLDDSVGYCPPENIGLMWQRLTEIVNCGCDIGPDFTQEEAEKTLATWQKQVINILMDKDIFDVNKKPDFIKFGEFDQIRKAPQQAKGTELYIEYTGNDVAVNSRRYLLDADDIDGLIEALKEVKELRLWE